MCTWEKENYMAFSGFSSIDYLITSHPPVTTNSFSVVAFVRRVVNDVSTQNIMQLFNHSSVAEDLYKLCTVETAGQLRVGTLSDGVTDTMVHMTLLNESEWTLVGGIFHANGVDRSVIVNSEIESAAGTHGNLVPASIDRLIVGLAGDLTGPWFGSIAELAFYDGVLTDNNVSDLSKGVSPLFVRYNDLISYYPLRDNFNDVIGGRYLSVVGALQKEVHPCIFSEQNVIKTRDNFLKNLTLELHFSLTGAKETEWEFTVGGVTFSVLTNYTGRTTYSNVISSGIDFIQIQLPFGHEVVLRTRQRTIQGWQIWSNDVLFSVPYFNSYDRYLELSGLSPLTTDFVDVLSCGSATDRSSSSSGSDSDNSAEKYSTGWGVIVNIDNNNNDGSLKTADITESLSYDYVDHIQATFWWSNLEPTEGNYDFSSVEDALETFDAAGKKMIWSLLVYGGTGGAALPSWYDGIRVASDTQNYPLLWDDYYKAKLVLLFDALSDAFKNDSRIEGFRGTVGGSVGTFEPSAYGSDTGNATLQAALESYGLQYSGSNPIYDVNSPYTQVVDYLNRQFSSRFIRHACIVTIHFPSGNVNASDYGLDTTMRNTNQELGLVPVNTGLNQGVNSSRRQYFVDTKAAGCWRTGWGGITGILNDDEAGWYPAMRAGIGGEFPEGSFQPSGACSYITVNITGSLPEHEGPVIYGRDILSRT